MLGRRVWWCAAAMVGGIGAALLAGAGSAAAADDGASDGAGATSQESTSTGSEASASGAATSAVDPQPSRAVSTLNGAAVDSSADTAGGTAAPAAAQRPLSTLNGTPMGGTENTSATESSTEAASAADEPETTIDDVAVTQPPEVTPADDHTTGVPPATTVAKPTMVTDSSPIEAPQSSPVAEAVVTDEAPAPAPATEEAQLVTAKRSLAAPVANAPPEPAIQQQAVQDPGPLLPGVGNGVTGVQVGHAPLAIPVANGYTAPADWYFPTQADGSVAAQGTIWLQHGFGAINSLYASLATELARQTNSIVVAPTIASLPSLFCGDCYLGSTAMQQAAATMFLDGQTALNASAAAAGFQGTLPTTFILSGHSAGGGFATAVAAATVLNGAAAGRLRGVVMFDGVATGALDGSGSFTGQLATLDTLNVPVYQIAAPAQVWNAFGATTNALLAARPGQFDGVVMVGGSHVDSMLGPNPLVNFVLQLVTRPVPAGNTAATYTLSTGWINDMYVGATPQAPQYGFYAGPNQQIIMGNAAAVGLPSPIANQLSPVDALLKSVFDFFGGLFGLPAAPTPSVAAVSSVTPVLTPPMTNGVTGVKTGTAALDIPCGNGCTVSADWYFPTQADGTVAANGITWLQHGFLGFKSWYSDLATQIAQQTNTIVVAPNIFWFDTPFNPGCYLGGTKMHEAVASMFLGSRAALNISANAAGFGGTLPQDFLLTGHSAGGNFATAVGGFTVDNGAAADLLGVVMFDGVSNNSDGFAAALAKLDSLGVPDYQIAAPPQSWNAWGTTTELLSALHPGQFTGVMIDNGSHTDSLGGNWLADLASALLVRPSPPGGKAAVQTFATGWINDIYAGKGPTDPLYGIYGNPNDGTYVADQPIVMGRAGATTLPAPPPVDVNSYLGTWYEQGSVKLPFEWFLVNITADYSLNSDGSIRVQNSGNYFTADGPQSNIVGSAVPVNDYNTRLAVNFFLPLFGNGEPGNYWILDYAPDYSWAIVSDPTHFSGYILSRTQTTTDAQYQDLVDRARQLGVWGPITRTAQYPTTSAPVAV